MKFEKLDVDAQQSNGLKPLLKLSEDKNTLRVQQKCECGKLGVAVDFQPLTPEIQLNMSDARAEAERRGVPARIPIAVTRSIRDSCLTCKREIITTINFTLQRKWLRSFAKEHNQDIAQTTYGKVINISAEIKGGWFGNFRRIPEPRYLINDVSCCCGGMLGFREITEKLYHLIREVDDFFEKEGAPTPKPFEHEEMSKCLNCLRNVRLKIKTTLNLPQNKAPITEIVAFWRAWEGRTRP